MIVTALLLAKKKNLVFFKFNSNFFFNLTFKGFDFLCLLTKKKKRHTEDPLVYNHTVEIMYNRKILKDCKVENIRKLPKLGGEEGKHPTIRNIVEKTKAVQRDLDFELEKLRIRERQNKHRNKNNREKPPVLQPMENKKNKNLSVKRKQVSTEGLLDKENNQQHIQKVATTITQEPVVKPQKEALSFDMDFDF